MPSIVVVHQEAVLFCNVVWSCPAETSCCTVLMEGIFCLCVCRYFFTLDEQNIRDIHVISCFSEAHFNCIEGL